MPRCHDSPPYTQTSQSAPTLAGTYAASSYCIRKGLIRKVQFAHNTKKWAAKHPGGRLARSLPETWPLQLDDVEYIDEALCDVPEVRLLCIAEPPKL